MPGDRLQRETFVRQRRPLHHHCQQLVTTNYTDATSAPAKLIYYIVTMTVGVWKACRARKLASGAVLAAPFMSRDVGSVGLAGSASSCGGPFTISGSGADIWYQADAFQFVYVPMNGDGEIRARVLSVQNTSGNAKGGVMIRETLTAASKLALMDLRHRVERESNLFGGPPPEAILAPVPIPMGSTRPTPRPIGCD